MQTEPILEMGLWRITRKKIKSKAYPDEEEKEAISIWTVGAPLINFAKSVSLYDILLPLYPSSNSCVQTRETCK